MRKGHLPLHVHARVRMWRACCEVGMERGWSDVRVLPEDPRTEEWQNILPRWEYRSGPQGRSFERDERRCGDYCSGNGE